MYEAFLLIGLIVIGILTSYSDLKYGLIRNKVLLAGLIYVVLINIIFFFLGEISFSNFNYFYNALFILFICFLFWYVGLWTAGDAKLFFLFNLFLPPSILISYTGSKFYGFTFFVNIFVFVGLYFVYRIIRKISFKQFKMGIRKTFSLNNIVTISFFMFSMGFMTRFINLPFMSNFFTNMFIFFGIFSLIRYFFKEYLIHVLLILCIIRVYFEKYLLLTPSFWISFVVSTITFLLLRFFLLRLSYLAFTYKVPINELEPKLFLAEDVIPVRVLDSPVIHYKKSKIQNFTFISYLSNQYFKKIDYDPNIGITAKNIEWFNNQGDNLLFRKIRVYETIPFAPILFLGFLVSFLAQGDVVLAASKLIVFIFGI